MKNTLLNIYEKDGTKKVLASLLSIFFGLAVGAIVVAIVGMTKDSITGKGIWDGVRLIFGGILCTGRDASGNLSWPLFRGNTLGKIHTNLIAIINKGNTGHCQNKGHSYLHFFLCSTITDSG